MNDYAKCSNALREYSNPSGFREELVSVNPIKISDLIAKVEGIDLFDTPFDTPIRVILLDNSSTFVSPKEFRERISVFDDESNAKIETYKVGTGLFTHTKVMITDYRIGDAYVEYFTENKK